MSGRCIVWFAVLLLVLAVIFVAALLLLRELVIKTA